MFTIFAKVLKLLNSETDPGQIALALCFGMVAGFTPLMSLHNLGVLLLVCLLRANLSAFFLGLGLFTTLAFALDPVFDKLGMALLLNPSLEPTWTALYNNTLWRIEHFNNSVVMGSLIVSIAIFFPTYFVFTMLIRKYRETWMERIKQTGIAKAIMASKFWGIYQKISGVTGE